MSGRFDFSLALDDAKHIAAHLRAKDRDEVDATTEPMGDDDRAQQLIYLNGTKFTVWDKHGEAVAMGGWMPLWPGVVSSWLLATDKINEVGVSLDHAALRGHKELVHVHRFQAFGIHGHEAARAWLFQLGYQIEGVHHGFGRSGETFISFAKVRLDRA